MGRLCLPLPARQAANGRIRALMKLCHCKNALLIPGAIRAGSQSPLQGISTGAAGAFSGRLSPLAGPVSCADPLKACCRGTFQQAKYFMCILCTAARKRAAVVRTKAFPARRPGRSAAIERARTPPAAARFARRWKRRLFAAFLFDENRGRFYDRPCLYSAAWQCRL